MTEERKISSILGVIAAAPGMQVLKAAVVVLALAIAPTAAAPAAEGDPQQPAATSASEGAPEAASEAGAEFEGLPEGPGREAVYFNCTACHSIRQVTQQRMARDDWDALLDVMVANNGMHPLKPWARTRVLNYLATHYGTEDAEDWGGLKPGKGREVVFYACQACHSLAIVKQQGLSRPWWNQTLTWMVEDQGMPELDEEDRTLVLDYLTANYGPESQQ